MVTVKMTPEQFAAKSLALQAQGISITGNSGTAQKSGVTIQYAYDPEHGELYCAIEKKPMFVPLAVAESRLRSWLTT